LFRVTRVDVQNIKENMKIVYEDDDVIVVDKPYNYATHPAATWTGPTVVQALTGRNIKTSGDAERQGIVHRLDVGTSGLLVVAKNENAYQNLIEQWKKHTPKKKYYALVQGYVEPAHIKLPIARKPSAFTYEVNKNGKMAETKYNVIDKKNGLSFVDIELLTGRTHQIRVHFSFLKHPVVGDKLYGANPKISAQAQLDRHFLHSYYLQFVHPATGKQVEFTSELPAELRTAYGKLML